MSISLAVDNVTELPVNNLNDIPAMMRKVADQIEAGEHGYVASATLVTEGEMGVGSFHWSESSNAHERIGMLHGAIYCIMRDLHGDGM